MPDLDEQLRSYLDALASDVERRVDQRPQLQAATKMSHRSRWAAVAIAALVVVIAAAALVRVTSDDDESGHVSVGTGTSGTAPSGNASIAGVWRTLPTVLDTRLELSPFAVALDDDRVLVLFLENGGNDVAGEVIDIQRDTAAAIAPSGLRWRAFALVGWTGSEVVIAGGSNGPGIDVVGAAYDPQSNTWRRIAAPPGFVPGRSENQVIGPGVWSGRELISWQSRLAYNPTTDVWRTIAAAPLDARIDETVVATPEGVLVWGGCGSRATEPTAGEASGACDDTRQGAFSDGAIYDPSSDRWTKLPAGPLSGGVGAMSVWTPWEGGVIIVVPDPADPAKASAAAFAPNTFRWRALASPPAGAPRSESALVWTGSHAVVWGGYATDISGRETERGFALDPATQKWSELPPGGGARRGHTAVWTEHGLFVVGGSPIATPVIFTPAGSLSER